MKTHPIAAAGVLLAQLSVCGAQQPQAFEWATGTFAGQADVPIPQPNARHQEAPC